MVAANQNEYRAEVIAGLPFGDYAARPEAHATALRYLMISPLAYRRHVDAPRKETDAMRLGKAVHTAVLEPMRFLREYALWEGGRRAGKVWDAFCEANNSKTILTSEQYEHATRIQQAVRSHEVAGAYLSEAGKVELTIKWTHPRTGVRVKCRLDWLSSSGLVDLKTCRDVAPARFATSAAQYGYALQMALYADAVAAAGLGAVPRKIIAVQSSEPFDVVVYDIDNETHAIGVQQYEQALDRLVECTRSGAWPGMAPAEEVPLRLPAWSLPQEDDEPLTFNGQEL